MPVSEPTAYALLKAFGMLEFNLKRMNGFLAAEGNPLVKRAKAKADWSAVDRAVAALPQDEFLGRISQESKVRMLGGERKRPQVQFVKVSANGNWSAKYEDSDLPPNDAVALVVAMRRVRNNLFHGGKEDPLEDPGNEDQSWAEAALEIAELLLDLMDHHRLRPV